MKKPTNLQVLLYLILAALAFEVIVLARQNRILKKQVYSGLAAQAGSQKEIKDGMSLVPITLTSFDQEEFILSYNKPGKKTLLYFFSLTCPQCLRNIPQWRQLAAELQQEESVDIIAISKGGVENVQSYAEGYNLNYRIGVSAEADTTINRGYGIQYVPTTVLLDDSACVIKSFVGVLSDDNRQEILNSVLPKTKMK